MRQRSREAGMTLVEVLIAVTLVSLLSVGMLFAIRVGLNAYAATNVHFTESRKVLGAQRILEQQLSNLLLTTAECRSPEQSQPVKVPFFQGEPGAMRLVSSYSLNSAQRGVAQMLEFLVIPGDPEVGGVRLVVNEIPFSGSRGLGFTCLGQRRDEFAKANVTLWVPIQTGPGSFVLADRLAACRLSYLERRTNPYVERWVQRWVLPQAPAAIRVEMIPLQIDQSRLQPMTLTVPIRVTREWQVPYAD